MNTTLMFISIFLMVLAIASGNSCDGCSDQGECKNNNKCVCYVDKYGNPMFHGSKCQHRTCPQHKAWFGSVVNSNDMSPVSVCSAAGKCNKKTGECLCYNPFEGDACQRMTCPNNCSNKGHCMSQKEFADEAYVSYEAFDKDMITGCKCDFGARGPDCSQIECPSGPDISGGKGAEQGRDCSGRGRCDYSMGVCHCDHGYKGAKCNIVSSHTS
jgi:hypothetical protein